MSSLVEAEGIGSFQNAYSLVRKFKVLPPPSIPLHNYFYYCCYFTIEGLKSPLRRQLERKANLSF